MPPQMTEVWETICHIALLYRGEGQNHRMHLTTDSQEVLDPCRLLEPTINTRLSYVQIRVRYEGTPK